jgi:bacteriorhodopsin
VVKSRKPADGQTTRKEAKMPELTYIQYFSVYNLLSLAIASMMATFVFFALVRKEVSPKYRGAVTAGAMVVFIAAYHYFRIFNNWEAAYQINPSGGYSPSGLPFNNAYRYIDWMLTVPLLVIELILVLDLPRKQTSSLIAKLGIAAFLMIILGYFGEGDRASTSVVSARGLWGTLSTIPFLYILVVLLGEIRASMQRSSPEVAILLRNTALLTLFAWGFYPIAYMAPFFGLKGAGAEMSLQVGYSLADIIAKCGYGLLIHAIAVHRTEEEVVRA